MRLAQRCPEHAGLLGFAPGHVLIGEGPHKALHRLHGVGALRRLGRLRPCAWYEPSPLRHTGRLGAEAGLHAVALEQIDEPAYVAGARAQIRHHPAPIFGVHDGRERRHRFARMPTGLAQHRGTAHHPRHEVDFGAFRHCLVDGARQVLSLPGAPAKEQRRDDGHGELLPGDVVGMPHLRGDRRQIVLPVGGRIVAAIHHDAPQRQVHQV